MRDSIKIKKKQNARDQSKPKMFSKGGLNSERGGKKNQDHRNIQCYNCDKWGTLYG